MFERQQEEDSLQGVQTTGKSLLECADATCQGKRIERESARIAAKKIARELIENEHARESRFCAIHPGIQATSRRFGRKVTVATSDFGVELRIDGKPDLRARSRSVRARQCVGKPKRQNRTDQRWIQSIQIYTVSSARLMA